jgi:hypothetical protein
MAMRRMFPQPDLFETPAPQIELAPAERTQVVEQLRELLMEAMAAPAVASAAERRAEAGDDEDHA